MCKIKQRDFKLSRGIVSKVAKKLRISRQRAHYKIYVMHNPEALKIATKFQNAHNKEILDAKKGIIKACDDKQPVN